MRSAGVHSWRASYVHLARRKRRRGSAPSTPGLFGGTAWSQEPCAPCGDPGGADPSQAQDDTYLFKARTYSRQPDVSAMECVCHPEEKRRRIRTSDVSTGSVPLLSPL